MQRQYLDLLACPQCGGPLAASLRCRACAAEYAAPDGIPDLRCAGGQVTETVRAFYSAAPFPGYPANASLEWLRARAGRSRFARLLDEGIAPDARIVEVGCGTGQMSLFLSGRDRVVVGADLTRPSLRLGATAARRFGIGNVLFVETDLLRPGLREAAFDVVYCSGVLHHTADPRGAFKHVARLARPGGMIVLGLYNCLGRIPNRLRRAAAKLSGGRWVPGDPVLNDRAAEPERREAWLRDQYDHPEEHSHSLGEVRGWFDENGVEYLRAYPSALLAREGEDDPLFVSQGDYWPLEAALAQFAWIWRLNAEGGLFVATGRRAA